MDRTKLPQEIGSETWKRALEWERQQEEAMARLRKPGEPPIVSTVEQQILEDLLAEKAADQLNHQAGKKDGLAQ